MSNKDLLTSHEALLLYLKKVQLYPESFMNICRLNGFSVEILREWMLDDEEAVYETFGNHSRVKFLLKRMKKGKEFDDHFLCVVESKEDSDVSSDKENGNSTSNKNDESVPRKIEDDWKPPSAFQNSAWAQCMARDIVASYRTPNYLQERFALKPLRKHVNKKISHKKIRALDLMFRPDQHSIMHGTHTQCVEKPGESDLYTLRVITCVNSEGCSKCTMNIQALFLTVRFFFSLCTNTHTRITTSNLQSKFVRMQEAKEIDKIEVVFVTYAERPKEPETLKAWTAFNNFAKKYKGQVLWYLIDTFTMDDNERYLRYDHRSEEKWVKWA